MHDIYSDVLQQFSHQNGSRTHTRRQRVHIPGTINAIEHQKTKANEHVFTGQHCRVAHGAATEKIKSARIKFEIRAVEKVQHGIDRQHNQIETIGKAVGIMYWPNNFPLSFYPSIHRVDAVCFCRFSCRISARKLQYCIWQNAHQIIL